MNDMTNTSQQYPFVEDATIVLGPGVFAAEDRSVLNWDGVNYVPQPAPQPPTREQIAEALYLDDADHEDWSWQSEDNPNTRAAYLKNADAVLALIQNGADR